MNKKQLDKLKKELANNLAREAAHQAWLNKFGRGCEHKEVQVSVSHPASGLSVARCKLCGNQVG